MDGGGQLLLRLLGRSGGGGGGLGSGCLLTELGSFLGCRSDRIRESEGQVAFLESKETGNCAASGSCESEYGH